MQVVLTDEFKHMSCDLFARELMAWRPSRGGAELVPATPASTQGGACGVCRWGGDLHCGLPTGFPCSFLASLLHQLGDEYFPGTDSFGGAAVAERSRVSGSDGGMRSRAVQQAWAWAQ